MPSKREGKLMGELRVTAEGDPDPGYTPAGAKRRKPPVSPEGS
jgi:hypothetical protein